MVGGLSIYLMSIAGTFARRSPSWMKGSCSSMKIARIRAAAALSRGARYMRARRKRSDLAGVPN